MPLSRAEREQFLAEPHIAAFSVDTRPGRGPLTVPLWYQYTPGGEPWILIQVSSRKARLIEAAGRFTLMVDRIEPTIRYVSVEGPVSGTEPMTDETLWELASRYLPEDHARAYAALSKAEHGEQQVVRMRPEHWLSADLGPS